eukprot:170276-Ditylum_brightwellii.AAC.1
MMANNSRPNGQTLHIDIGYFALQEWVTYGDIMLAHIHEIANQLLPSPRHWDGCCNYAMSSIPWDTWEQGMPTI